MLDLLPAHLYLVGELPLGEFEQWVYVTPELEGEWGELLYFELLSLDYRQKGAGHDVCKLLKSVVGGPDIELWRLRRYLSAIVEQGPRRCTALATMYDEYCGGYYFLDNLALAYGVRAWECQQGSLPEDTCHACAEVGAVDEARRALEWLNEGDIVLVGQADELDRVRFEDRRPAPEKLPRT